MAPNSRTRVSQLLSLDPTARTLPSSVGAAHLKTACFGLLLQDWRPLSSQQQLLLDTRLQTSCFVHCGEAGLLSTSLVTGPQTQRPIMGAGPSLQRRVSTLPKLGVALVPSLCHLEVVAARVVAQLFSLTLHWVCSCSVHKTGPAPSGCASLLVPSFLL